MKRRIAAAAALTAILACVPVLAQVVPGDFGAGQERGLQEMNNSGEVGTATVYDRGPATSIVINLKGQPAGRRQPAHLHRGKACDSSVDPKPAYPLNDVVNGRSSSGVDLPVGRVLSGNYVVIVHASAQNMNRYVSCGQLYQ